MRCLQDAAGHTSPILDPSPDRTPMAEAVLSPAAAALATLHELSKTAKVNLYELALKSYAVDGERRLVLLPLPT